MINDFGGTFEGKTVLVTGHTGFKGSWLSLWLKELGATVIGYSLPAPTTPSHFSVSRIQADVISVNGDIRDYTLFKTTLDRYQPEIIFHLAAQPIVLQSFNSPKDTFDINAGGTVNILEAARHCPSIKAMVMVTSDKCYQNQEWIWGYRESDLLGGSDPYSASKGMAEMAIAAYRASYSSSSPFPAIASARAGNVIGGGDFSESRIVPDCMRALMDKQPVRLRNPNSTRPWLHVLDALSGYLNLAAHLINKGMAFASAWNFGPLEHQAISVQTLIEKGISFWGEGDWLDISNAGIKQEMNLLRLNWDKAAAGLEWCPTYNCSEAIQQTVEWFKCYDLYRRVPCSLDMHEVSLKHLYAYTAHAKRRLQAWSLTEKVELDPCPQLG
ncbi:MAG: CDP-glucose 4,6-dehydratase [Parachlamydiaceae bacterium]|nr:CDP-glucose 4,6-dehydratase [Parachlamydiaceae bacterium]